jgi:hypothetical protein
MPKRSIADGKIRALVEGRNRYEGLVSRAWCENVGWLVLSENSIRLDSHRKTESSHHWERRLRSCTRSECWSQIYSSRGPGLRESHLRRVLSAYAAYYNQARTHLALQKDAPLHRAVQRSGVIVAIPILACVYRKRHPYWLAEGIAQRRGAIAAILPGHLALSFKRTGALPLLPTFRQWNA